MAGPEAVQEIFFFCEYFDRAQEQHITSHITSHMTQNRPREHLYISLSKCFMFLNASVIQGLTITEKEREKVKER